MRVRLEETSGVELAKIAATESVQCYTAAH